MEARLARVDSDVRHIKSDISEIKGVLGRLAPRIDEIYGKFPHLATKEDPARFELTPKEDLAGQELTTKEDFASLSAEIDKRPTRRQTMDDIAMIVGLIGALITSGTRLAH